MAVKQALAPGVLGLGRGVVPKDKTATDLSESIADYCREELEIKKELEQVTISRYKQQLIVFCNWLGDREPSANLGALFLAEFRQQGYSKASIRSYYAAIRPFLKWRGIDLTLKFKRLKRLPSYHSHDEFERLLNVVRERKDTWAAKKKERDLLILRTFALTGIRKSELLAIRCQDIKESYLVIPHGKGDKPRVIPLKEKLFADLTDYIRKKNLAPADRIFPLSQSRLGVIVRGYGLKAGTRFTPHKLRHYFATEIIRQGGRLPMLQELLGHEDLSTTGLYTDVVPKHLRDTVELLEDE